MTFIGHRNLMNLNYTPLQPAGRVQYYFQHVLVGLIPRVFNAISHRVGWAKREPMLPCAKEVIDVDTIRDYHAVDVNNQF